MFTHYVRSLRSLTTFVHSVHSLRSFTPFTHYGVWGVGWRVFVFKALLSCSLCSLFAQNSLLYGISRSFLLYASTISLFFFAHFCKVWILGGQYLGGFRGILGPFSLFFTFCGFAYHLPTWSIFGPKTCEICTRKLLNGRFQNIFRKINDSDFITILKNKIIGRGLRPLLFFKILDETIG